MEKNGEHNEVIKKIKILILFNTSVGKTSFILKYANNYFQEEYLSSIGIDFIVKEIIIKDIKYKLILYDTAGQERFKSLSLNVLKNADGVILIYDITDVKSFQSISEWIKNVKEMKRNNFPMILLGNKIDLEEQRKVKIGDGEKLALKNKIKFFEISNKTGVNINSACLFLVDKILEYNEENLRRNTSIISSETSISLINKKKCC